MATLDELMTKFGSAAPEETPAGGEATTPEPITAVEDGQTKLASGGDGDMKSLQDIYLAIANEDFAKQAAAAAGAPLADPEPQGNDGDVDFAKLADQIAGREANEIVAEDGNILKVAAEYDAAGRLIARGFYSELLKLGGAMDTDVTPNQETESESAAATPALGERGLPTVETNFAGNEAHDQKIETAGQEPKQVYKDTLKPAKTISAGQGTGDDPEAAAVSLGGGSPAGFATVKDLMGGTPA